MRLRTSLRLPRRSQALEVGLALLGAFAIGVNTGEGDSLQTPLPQAIAGAALLAVLLFLFRRTAPLVPFVFSALLAAVAPAVTTAIPITS